MINKFRVIQIVTGSRAEYGILRNLIKKINLSKHFILKLVVTGSHLSEGFGNTISEIKADKFFIDKKIEMQIDTNSKVGVIKSIGLGLISLSEYIDESKPDLIIILGDRYEMLSVAISALISGVPIAHIHGGEVTKGAYDDSIRHAITKMSYIHFVAAEEYKRRLIQLGESPSRVFNIGSLGIDSIHKIKFLKKEKLEKEINFSFGKKNILVTYHPTTLGMISSKEEIKEIIKALNQFEDISFIFTFPNADNSSNEIIKVIKDFCENRRNCIFIKSLGQLKYFSCISYVDCVLGNSSSGIIEVPSFNKATINIGSRQDGRLRAQSIIDCDVSSKSICEAIEKIYSVEFRKKIVNTSNPYGNSGALEKLFEVLENFQKPKNIQKEFYDIN